MQGVNYSLKCALLSGVPGSLTAAVFCFGHAKTDEFALTSQGNEPAIFDSHLRAPASGFRAGRGRVVVR